jgi:valyl-tRNA synthetase
MDGTLVTASDLETVKEQFENLAKAKLVAIGPDIARPNAAASFSLGAADGYIPLAGLIDLAAEKARQLKEAEKLRGFIAASEKKLSNTSFTDRAPPEVVQEVRDTLAQQRKQLSSIEDIIRQLDAA